MGRIMFATSNSTDEEYGGTIATQASDVAYDNTTSGLTADDVQGAVDGLALDVEKLKTFSETEEVIGEWTDSSTLYRKVFNVYSLSTGDNNIPLNITNLDKIVKIDSTFSAWGYTYVAPIVSNDTANSINFTIGSNNIIVTSGSNIAGNLTRLTIILTYTKSS